MALCNRPLPVPNPPLPSSNAPPRVVVFVSKMFAVPTSSLPDPAAAFAATAAEAAAAAAVTAAEEGVASTDVAACPPSFPTALRPPAESAWWGMPTGASSASLDLRGVGASRDAVVAGLRRRQQSRRAAAAVASAAAASAEGSAVSSSAAAAAAGAVRAAQSEAAAAEAIPGFGDDDASAVETFVAFARVFSGTLRPGEEEEEEL